MALHCLILLTMLSAPRASGPRFYNLAGRCQCLQSDGLKSVFKTDAVSQMTMMDARDFARLRSCHNHNEIRRPKNGFKPVWYPLRIGSKTVWRNTKWKSSFVLSFSLKHLHMQTCLPPPYSELATPIIGTQHLGQPPHLIVGKHKILAWHKQ